MKHKHVRLLCLLTGFVFLVCLGTLMDVLIAFIGNTAHHVQNAIHNHPWMSSCTVRKWPVLMAHGNRTLRVVWEASCFIEWQVVTEVQADGNSATLARTLVPVEHTPLDPSHHLYEALLTAPSTPLFTSSGKEQILHYQYTIAATSSAGRQLKGRTLGPFAIPCPPFGGGKGLSCSFVRIGCLSDNQFAAVTFRRVFDRLIQHHPHYVVHAGDAVQHGDALDEWQTDFFDVVSSQLSARPLLHAAGNHDEESRDSLSIAYLRGFRPPWFSVDIGSARWLILNSNRDEERQDIWLEKELMSAQKEAHVHFVVVVVHIPPFGEYWDRRAWFELGERHWGSFVRERFVPLFEKYRVDLVISGHQHGYQRGERKGVIYTIIGGAGGSLESERVEDWQMYSVTKNDHHFIMMDMYPKELHWHAYSLDGHLYDKFTLISKRWSRDEPV